jgi:DNA invertase Pin-like site-specific DNA recombinase
MERKKNVIYARVSSMGDRQSTDRQVEDLTRYAEGKGLEIVRIFQEHVSGAKSNREREVLAECLEFCRAEHPDTLMVTELSRLGRSTVEVLKAVEDLTAAGVNVFILDLNLSTLDEEGRENPVAKMVLTVLALGAEMERKLILGRLNSGRELAKKRGVTMGRPKGATDDLLQKHPEVVKHLRKGKNSIREIAKLTGVSVSTVQRVKAALWRHEVNHF